MQSHIPVDAHTALSTKVALNPVENVAITFDFLPGGWIELSCVPRKPHGLRLSILFKI